MKRFLQLMLACAMIVSLASVAVAAAPTPVTRMGDWVEIGNDVFMNMIAINTIRYQTSHNFDFEDDRRDLGRGGSVNSSTNRNGGNDIMFAEIRFGADFRYKKNTKMRVLFETESIFDGNLIDDRTNNDDGTENSPHVERFWVEHKFEGTPIRARIGSYLWCWDIACTIADDDPGTHLWVDLKPVELKAAVIVEREGYRLDRTNDNDNIQYMFAVNYNAKPHLFGISMSYNRDRYNNNAGGQETDQFVIMPGYKGKIGPVELLGQFSVSVGEVRTPVEDYDHFGYSFIGAVSVDLGKVRPRFGVLYASGDDDANDDDIEGYNPRPGRDVMLISMSRAYPDWDGSMYDNNAPCAMNDAICGGETGPHTITSPFNDRIGNTLHPGANSALSNPGTLHITAGVEIFPVKKHTFRIWYAYIGVADEELMEAQAQARSGDPDYDVSSTLMHEIGAWWTWKINKHLQVDLRGNIIIPGEAQQDIAELHFTCGDNGAEQCEGEDIALLGEIQVRGAF